MIRRLPVLRGAIWLALLGLPVASGAPALAAVSHPQAAAGHAPAGRKVADLGWAAVSPAARSLPGAPVWRGLRPASPAAHFHLNISQLYGVSTPSKNVGWAVGTTCRGRCANPAALIMRRHGTSWKRVAASGPRLREEELTAVSADSAADAWAVGGYCASSCGAQGGVLNGVILHWNGTSWAEVANPVAGTGFSLLEGVTALSPTNVWAVGFECPTGCTALQTLVLHWDGASWTQATTPNPNANYNQLFAVAASSPTRLWSAGVAGPHALILGGDGSSWTRYPSASAKLVSFLGSVSADPSGSAWTGGLVCPDGCRSSHVPRSLLERWNGTAWVATPVPRIGKGGNVIYTVLDTSARSAWASGYYCAKRCGKRTERDDAMLLRWNGKHWRRSHLAAKLAARGAVFAASAVSARNAWLAGSYCAARCGTPSEKDVPLLLHWNGRKWVRV